jgi:hypothetical protein
MSEGCSDEGLNYQGSMSVDGPSVVTFQDPSKKSEVSASDRALKKAFMVRIVRLRIRSAQLSATSVIESIQTPARILESNKEIKIWGR